MAFNDHFSGHAATYREARPLYPDALFDWLADQGIAAATLVLLQPTSPLRQARHIDEAVELLGLLRNRLG